MAAVHADHSGHEWHERVWAKSAFSVGSPFKCQIPLPHSLVRRRVCLHCGSDVVAWNPRRNEGGRVGSIARVIKHRRSGRDGQRAELGASRQHCFPGNDRRIASGRRIGRQTVLCREDAPAQLDRSCDRFSRDRPTECQLDRCMFARPNL
jgi:hypothetical protein